MMDCDACGHKWAAVHRVQTEYAECPVCHHMTPTPAAPLLDEDHP